MVSSLFTTFVVLFLPKTFWPQRPSFILSWNFMKKKKHSDHESKRALQANAKARLLNTYKFKILNLFHSDNEDTAADEQVPQWPQYFLRKIWTKNVYSICSQAEKLTTNEDKMITKAHHDYKKGEYMKNIIIKTFCKKCFLY